MERWGQSIFCRLSSSSLSEDTQLRWRSSFQPLWRSSTIRMSTLRSSSSSGTIRKPNSIKHLPSMTERPRELSEKLLSPSLTGYCKYFFFLKPAPMPTMWLKVELCFPYLSADLRCCLVTQRCDIKPVLLHSCPLLDTLSGGPLVNPHGVQSTPLRKSRRICDTNPFYYTHINYYL